MRAIIAFVAGLLTLLAVGRGAEEPPFLVGTFQSDKEATIARWVADKTFGDRTDKFVEVFGKILGKHKVTISQNRLRSELDGVIEEQQYELLARDQKTARIRVFSTTFEQFLEAESSSLRTAIGRTPMTL